MAPCRPRGSLLYPRVPVGIVPPRCGSLSPRLCSPALTRRAHTISPLRGCSIACYSPDANRAAFVPVRRSSHETPRVAAAFWSALTTDTDSAAASRLAVSTTLFPGAYAPGSHHSRRFAAAALLVTHLTQTVLPLCQFDALRTKPRRVAAAFWSALTTDTDSAAASRLAVSTTLFSGAYAPGSRPSRRFAAAAFACYSPDANRAAFVPVRRSSHETPPRCSGILSVGTHN